MSEQNLKFENFFPRPLAFADKAHELEMMSKWNDAKVTLGTSLEAATAEANKRIAELESEVAELKDTLYGYDELMDADDKKIVELQAVNRDLRGLLIDARDDVSAELDNCAMKLPYKTERYEYQKTLLDNIDAALSKTPAESLQALKEVK